MPRCRFRPIARGGKHTRPKGPHYREKGDMVSSTDWSDKESIEIPEARCAYINITSSDGSAATWPTTK